jgi:hypothetical protein
VVSELKYPYRYKVFIHGVLKKSDSIENPYVLNINCNKDHIFNAGFNWLLYSPCVGELILCCWTPAAYAEANVAFNYANFTLGIRGRFTELAKSLVAESECVDNAELKKMAKQMDSVLTATTEDKISLTM